MNKSLIKLRVAQLRAMDKFVRSVNDEELADSWFCAGVPDEATAEDYIFIASDDELYQDCVRIFRSIAANEEAYY